MFHANMLSRSKIQEGLKTETCAQTYSCLVLNNERMPQAPSIDVHTLLAANVKNESLVNLAVSLASHFFLYLSGNSKSYCT